MPRHADAIIFRLISLFDFVSRLLRDAAPCARCERCYAMPRQRVLRRACACRYRMSDFAAARSIDILIFAAAADICFSPLLIFAMMIRLHIVYYATPFRLPLFSMLR